MPYEQYRKQLAEWLIVLAIGVAAALLASVCLATSYDAGYVDGQWSSIEEYGKPIKTAWYQVGNRVRKCWTFEDRRMVCDR